MATDMDIEAKEMGKKPLCKLEKPEEKYTKNRVDSKVDPETMSR